MNASSSSTERQVVEDLHRLAERVQPGAVPWADVASGGKRLRSRRHRTRFAATASVAAIAFIIAALVPGAWAPEREFITDPGAEAGATHRIYLPTTVGHAEEESPQSLGQDWRHLVGVTVPAASSTGDRGLDALRTLLATHVEELRQISPFLVANVWADSLRADAEPMVNARGVTHAEGLITVEIDANVDLGDPWPTAFVVIPRPSLLLQQIVWTLHDALDSTDPVQLLVDGERLDRFIGHRLNGPLSAEPVILDLDLSAPNREGQSVAAPDTTDPSRTLECPASEQRAVVFDLPGPGRATPGRAVSAVFPEIDLVATVLGDRRRAFVYRIDSRGSAVVAFATTRQRDGWWLDGYTYCDGQDPSSQPRT